LGFRGDFSLERDVRDRSQHLFLRRRLLTSLRRRLLNAASRELFRLWIARRSNAVGGRCKVVLRVPKLNVASEQKPVRTRSPKWHPDAAGVDNPCSSYHPIELHVRMTTDHQSPVHSLKDRQQAVFRRQTSEAFNFASWYAVAKEHAAHFGKIEPERPGQLRNICSCSE
jgi:hypothetical protein